LALPSVPTSMTGISLKSARRLISNIVGFS
jgi:hypothetical protein